MHVPRAKEVSIDGTQGRGAAAVLWRFGGCGRPGRWCNVLMDDLVAWIDGLFDDCAFRAPFAIDWHLDRGEPPLAAAVTPADCSTAWIVLDRDDVLGRISFAERLQAFLDVELDRPVPPCPVHRVGLTPIRVADAVAWRCPEGDFRCSIGDYQEALWPPAPEEDPDLLAPMLARRLSRRGVAGIASFGVERRDGRCVAEMEVGPQADEGAIRKAADPVSVEFERVEDVRTVRVSRPATDREPAHRALSLAGAGILLAALHGTLRRAGPGDPWDFFVDGVPVRLTPEHQLGPPGGPVLLDASGDPFAEEGDSVCCVGGFGKTGPVPGQTRVFHAGELRVYEQAAEPA